MFVSSLTYFRIDSEHNRTVLNNITKEIGTEKYTERQIKGTFAILIMF